MANPKEALYRQLREPFPSMEDAQRASDAFHAELADLRAKHRMRELLVVTQFGYHTTDDEADAIIYSSFGDPMKCESMAAYALGMIQSDRQKRIGELLKGVRTGRRDT